MTSREECEKAYLYLLKHCYEATKKNDTYDFAPSGFKESEVFKQLIEEHFDKNGNVKVLANIVIDEEIKKLIVPEPYKFEDLKPNMWVYDIKVKWLFKIVSVDIGIEALKHYVFVVENRDGSTSLINFEENRFFPVQYANYLGGI